MEEGGKGGGKGEGWRREGKVEGKGRGGGGRERGRERGRVEEGGKGGGGKERITLHDVLLLFNSSQTA